MLWENIKKVMGSNVLIKRTPTALVESSILVMPDTVIAYDKSICEVIATGPGEILLNGEREPMPINVGDKVYCWSGYGESIGDGYSFVDISMIEGLVK